MFTTAIRRACAAAIAVGTPLLTVSAFAAPANAGCTLATLSGVYSYSYTGFTIAANHAQIPFAVAGYGSYDGLGNIKGASTTTTTNGKQAMARSVPYTGLYTVAANCRVAEIDTDVTGAVTNYLEYTGPNGSLINFVETDPNVVSTGTQTRD